MQTNNKVIKVKRVREGDGLAANRERRKEARTRDLDRKALRLQKRG